jgi:hypothetical protein
MVCSDLLNRKLTLVGGGWLVRALAACSDERAIHHELDAANVRLRDATWRLRPVMSAMAITVYRSNGRGSDHAAATVYRRLLADKALRAQAASTG